MSSQSGIVPSDEVIIKFHDFISSGNRALVLTINPQLLTVSIDKSIPGSSNLNADLDGLISNDVCNDTDCLYLILNYGHNTKYAFISYVPDNAIVKSKMLYASTKNTLLRSLGGEYFNPILFINSPEELNSSGWAKIINSNETDVPLTESEMNLKSVKESELASSASSSLGVASGKLVNDSNTTLLFQIDPELESLLSSSSTIPLGSLISLEISNEILKLIKKASDVSASNLIKSISSIQGPAYHLYVSDGGLKFFILTCPSGSKVRDRMLYAANKQGLLNHLKSNNWDFSKVIEAGDADEIELSEFATDSNSSASTNSNRLKFAKPKGPRRR